ncbi:Tudor domain-containing protein 1 [Holothuria leucospilota]|uniref:Tudor domain-containing protein 1 n=1 Tax=Holothuria leucospilota TaxID=206669 RepID=A0A9Q1H4Q0_HOLLE|nr:Tudor domain-containing protein 1 [Holothuria leucospilota]
MATSVYNCYMPKIGERKEVMVSHAECDKDNQVFVIWGQFEIAHVEKIEDALAELQDVAQRKEHPRGQLRPGDLCLAKSIQDNQWHRASIQTATGNDVLAFYVDYGSTEFVPRSRIRTLDETLALDYEAQAAKLLLRGIQPIFVRGGIKPGTLDYLDRYIVNKVFSCEPLELDGNAVYVKLYSLNGKRDVSAQFITDGFAEPGTHQPSIHSQPRQEEVETLHLPVMGMDVGQRDRVYVSHVVSPTQFWLQQEVVAVDLDDMMTDLQSYFGPEGGHRAEPLSNVIPNMPCVTRFSEDGQFYRAQVLRSTGLKSCEVFFVDYGNSEEVNITDLRALPKHFSKLPGAAIEGGLSGIDPASCTQKASVARFEELTVEKILCIKVDSVEGQKVLVSMVDPRSELNLSIGETLLKEKLATRTVARRMQSPKSPTDAFSSSGRSSSRTSNSSLPSPRGHSPVGKFKHPSLRVGSSHPVTVTYINSSCDFACQLLSDSPEFESMSEMLQREYSSKNPREGKLPNMQVGSVCCAQFSEDSNWYRAEVKNVTDMSAEVVFVDYGNHDVLPFSKIKQLDPSYMKMEAQSITCRMENIEDIPRHSDQMKVKFEELVGENELDAKICRIEGSVYIVELVDKMKRLNINEQMERFCASLKPHHQAPSSRNAAIEEFRKVDPKRREKMKVYVSNVESPNLFHCQPVSSAEELQNLMDDLNAHIGSTSAATKFQPKLQAPCVAQYSEDQIWYRAVVTGIKRSGDVEVRFVDFGNHETVSPGAIRPLASRFMAFPMQGIPCSLEGVSFKSWMDDDINKFTDMSGESELEVIFGNRVGENYEVKLISETGLCINEVFQSPARVTSPKERQPQPSHKVASSGRGDGHQQKASAPTTQGETGQYKERELKVGSTLDVYISHVENLSELWCQPAFTTKDLEYLMGQLHKKYSRLRPNELSVSNPRLGMACVAQFTEDKNWYRALVTNKQLNRVYVCFVDYGNFEYVPVSGIKKIDEDVMQTPVVAVKCSLKGAKDLESPQRVKKLQSLIDEVDCFSCNVISSANGVFEVDFTFGGGKSVADVLKRVAKQEEPKAAPMKLQTPPRGQRSSPKSPTSPKPSGMSYKDRSPPQPQRQFQSRPTSVPAPLPPKQDKSSDWDVEEAPSPSLPTPAPVVKAPPVAVPPPTFKHIKQQADLMVLQEFVDVVVSFIESPSKFWIQLASLCAEVDALMEKLNDEVSSGKLKKVSKVENGQLCVVRSPTDEALYRARVLKMVGEEVEVYYVDYGNRENVSKEAIFVISPELLKFPAQAIQCTLSSISKASPFTDDVVEKFTELTMDKQLVAKPVKRSVNRVEMELSDTSGEEDVNISLEVKKVLDESKMTTLPMADIPDDKSTAYVTQVEEDGSFYLQLASSTELLEQLHSEIQTAYAEEVPALAEAKPGQLCCGLYSEDNEWYRGVVESVLDSGEAKVKFVDYGNSSTSKVSDLKELQVSFLDKPPVAVKCELHDVPLTGISEIGNLLEELTLEKELTCQFLDKDIPCQVALSENDVNINAEISKRFDHSSEQPEVPTPEAGTHWVFPSMEVGKKIEAYVSSVVSPEYFFCQPVSVTQNLEDLMVEMQSVYCQDSAELLLSSGEILNGTLCAALYAEDNQWYRAEVVHQENDQVTVIFPDYGNSDVVEKKNLKVLHKKHSDLPLNAICCKLHGVKATSNSWTPESCGYFEAEVMDKLLLAEILEAPTACSQVGKAIHSVTLLDMGIKLTDKLIQAGHAVDINSVDEMSTTEKGELQLSSSPTFAGFSSYQLKEGTSEGIFITAVTSLNDFFIQLTRHGDEVAEFGAKVDEFYKNNEAPCVENVEVGVPCVAQFSEDEVWYRAVVEEITEDKVYVTFVDYGNGDTVLASSIKKLEEQFAKQPAYSFRSRLAGIEKSQSTDESNVEKFEGYMEKETLIGKFFCAKDGILDVQIQDEGTSVAFHIGLEEDLTQYQLSQLASSVTDEPNVTTSTSMYPGYVAKSLPQGTLAGIFLTSVTSLKEFYIQLTLDADPVANFTAELDEFYKQTETPSLETVEVGAICAAQFADDEVWYRAMVTSVEEDNADVLFVDYGNSDLTAKSTLKKLDEKFLSTPTFAIRCQLAGVDTSIDDEGVLAKFEEFLESETLQVKVVSGGDSHLCVQILQDGESITEHLGFKENVPKDMPDSSGSFSSFDMAPGDTEPVYLTSVTSLSDFAIQLKKFEDAVSDFSAKFDEFYKNNEIPPITSASVGTRCGAKFQDDEVWYRGIIDHIEADVAEVTFIDYGNSDAFNISELRELQKDFAVQHAYSFKCSLAGIGKNEITEDMETEFGEYLENDNLVAKVIRAQDEKLVVQLLDGDTSVAVQLGLSEDLDAEKMGEQIDTTAHSLAEDALSSAIKDIELEDSVSSTEEAGEQVTPEGAEVAACNPEEIASTLIQEVIDSACKEVSRLTIDEDECKQNGEAQELTTTTEVSPPGIDVASPGNAPEEEEDEFEDAQTSPRDETSIHEKTEDREIVKEEDNCEVNEDEAPQGEEDEFEDAETSPRDEISTHEKTEDGENVTADDVTKDEVDESVKVWEQSCLSSEDRGQDAIDESKEKDEDEILRDGQLKSDDNEVGSGEVGRVENSVELEEAEVEEEQKVEDGEMIAEDVVENGVKKEGETENGEGTGESQKEVGAENGEDGEQKESIDAVNNGEEVKQDDGGEMGSLKVEVPGVKSVDQNPPDGDSIQGDVKEGEEHT